MKLGLDEFVIQILGLVGVGHRFPHPVIGLAVVLNIRRPPGSQERAGRIQTVFAASIARRHEERLLGLGRIDETGIRIVNGPQQHQCAEQVDAPNESSGHVQAGSGVQGTIQSLEAFCKTQLQEGLSGDLKQLNHHGLDRGTRLRHQFVYWH